VLAVVQALELAQALEQVLEPVLEPVLEQVRGSVLALVQEYCRQMSADQSHRLEVGSLMPAEPHWAPSNPVESLS